MLCANSASVESQLSVTCETVSLDAASGGTLSGTDCLSVFPACPCPRTFANVIAHGRQGVLAPGPPARNAGIRVPRPPALACAVVATHIAAVPCLRCDFSGTLKMSI